MTVAQGYAYGGESRDIDAECAGLSHTTAAKAIATTAIQTGDRNVTLIMSLTLGSFDPSYLVAHESFFSTSFRIVGFHIPMVDNTTPTIAHGIISHQERGFKGYARFETDRKVRIYDKTSTQRGPASTSLMPVSGSTPQELNVIFDGYSLATVWCVVWFGDTLEMEFDTGLAWSDFFDTTRLPVFGEYRASDNKGVQPRIDDAYCWMSNDANDAPHLTAAPRPRIIGGMSSPPDAEGTYAAWNEGTTASPNTFQDVDDAGPYDGDTSVIKETSKGASHTFTSGVSSPVPSGATILSVNLKAVGRLATDGDVGAAAMLRRGGSDSFTAAAGTWSFLTGTAYTGLGAFGLARPGGGTWVDTDFGPDNPEFGAQTLNIPSLNSSPIISMLPFVDIVYYEDTLPLSGTPVSAATDERRRLLSQVI